MSNRTRMRVYLSIINYIFNNVSLTKTHTLLIDHFLNIARIDNIKCARNR